MSALSLTLPFLEDLLDLPSETRARLADALYGSLDQADASDPAKVEKAWASEIERRLQDLDAGRAKTLSLAESDRRLDALI